MRFDGEWLLCDDGAVRPVFRAELLISDNVWIPLELLVDTGADQTVLSANVAELLSSSLAIASDKIGGVGGQTDVDIFRTQLRFTRENNGKVVFRGDFAACYDPEMLDMSVLGRDILDLLALIIDRRKGIVCLVSGQHGYAITS